MDHNLWAINYRLGDREWVKEVESTPVDSYELESESTTWKNLNKRNRKRLVLSYLPSNLQHSLCAEYFERPIIRPLDLSHTANLTIAYQQSHYSRLGQISKQEYVRWNQIDRLSYKWIFEIVRSTFTIWPSDETKKKLD